MKDIGPSLTTSLQDKIIYDYSVLPWILTPLTTAQLLDFPLFPAKEVVSIFDPTGVNVIIPTPAGKENFNHTRISWKTIIAASLQNSVTASQVGWDGVTLKSWGNLNGPSVTIDGETPPLVQIGGESEYTLPRICQKISMPKFSFQAAFDFNSMTDPVNVIPDPAGPHSIFISLWVKVELIKKYGLN